MRNPEKFSCVVAADGQFTLADLATSSNPTKPFATSLLRSRDSEQLPWFDELVDKPDRLRTPTLIISERELPSTQHFSKKSNESFAQHVIGVTNLNRYKHGARLSQNAYNTPNRIASCSAITWRSMLRWVSRLVMIVWGYLHRIIVRSRRWTTAMASSRWCHLAKLLRPRLTKLVEQSKIRLYVTTGLSGC